MRTTIILSTTLTALTLMVLGLLLAGCAPTPAACGGGMVRIGSACCNDANDDGICDAGTAAATTGTGTSGASGAGSSSGTSGASTGTASGTSGASSGTTSGATASSASGTTLKARTLVDIQDALERYLNYYVVFKKDEVPFNHYEDVDNGIFTIYGSTNIDLLVVKDEKDWFTNFDDFEALMTRYVANRKEYNRARLERDLKKNQTFTHWVTLEQLAMPGATVLEYRDFAEIDLHGTNDMGAPYVDPIDPFGVVTILVPCKPNVVISFTSTRQPSKFVANYEGEEYRSELDKALNELSTEQQYRARKILSTCTMG